MGLSFNETISSRLAADFGGHPLLIRQMCSFIHMKVGEENRTRPFTVNKTYYEIKKEEFLSNESQGFNNYMQMVLEVLENWYEDEFEMLTLLSIGEYETFKELANESPDYVSHLLHYGIIEKSSNDYSFKIEALKKYLFSKNKYKALNLSKEQKTGEIMKRVDIVESDLRKIVRRQLKARFGEEIAQKKVIKEIYGGAKVGAYTAENYSNFFDSAKHDIYLKTVFNLMSKNWEDCFRHIFDVDVEEFKAKSTLIQKYRNQAAHVGSIEDYDFRSFRGTIEWLEQKIDEF